MRGAAIRSLSVVVACAGCFSDRGLAIEIDVGDTGATTVELYIGKQRCESGNDAGIDCKGITPFQTSDPTKRLIGEVWFRDDLLPYTAEVKGRTATFQLRSDTTYTVPLMIAVGLAPGREHGIAIATLRDVEVPAHRARIATAALVAVGLVDPGDTPRDTIDRVYVWTKAAQASSCLVVEHWDKGQAERDFVVPLEDADCDDVRNECNPAMFHGVSLGGMAARPDCFASAQQQSGCMLGSHGCTDDGGPGAGECAPQQLRQTCVPNEFCSCKDGIGDTCTETTARNPTVPHIECQVPVQLPLPIELCPDKEPAMIDLDAFYQGAKCDQQPLLSSLQLTNGGATYDFGGALMEVSSPRMPCNFTLDWESGSRNIVDTMDHGLLRVGTSSKTLLLPIKLEFVPDCTAAFACHLEMGNPSDRVWACTPQPPY